MAVWDLSWIVLVFDVAQAGQLRCWGTPRYHRFDQEKVPDDLKNADIKSFCNGFSNTCALKNDGTVQCWGQWANIKPFPADVTDAVAEIACRGQSWCYILEGTRSAGCWGACSTECAVPTDLAPVEQLALGPYHTCALQRAPKAGQVTCWGQTGGDKDYGQIQVPVNLAYSIAVAAGTYHTCSLSQVGEVTCWGAGKSGQNGVNDHGQAEVPSPLVANHISAGTWRTCATTQAGTVQCWGMVAGSGGNNFVQAATDYHTCARTQGGVVSCWGCEGDDDVPRPLANEQCDVPSDVQNVLLVDVGRYHSCALVAEDTITTTTMTTTTTTRTVTSTTTSITTTTTGTTLTTSISTTSSSTYTTSTSTTTTTSRTTTSSTTTTTSMSTSSTSTSSSSSSSSTSTSTSTTSTSSSSSRTTSTSTSSSSTWTSSTTSSSSSSTSTTSTSTSSSSTTSSTTSTSTSSTSTSSSITTSSTSSSSSSSSSSSTSTTSTTSTSTSSSTGSSTTSTYSSTSSTSTSSTSSSSSTMTWTATTITSSATTTVTSSTTSVSTTSATNTTIAAPRGAGETANFLLGSVRYQVMNALTQFATDDAAPDEIIKDFSMGRISVTKLDSRIAHTAPDEGIQVELGESEVLVNFPVSEILRVTAGFPYGTAAFVGVFDEGHPLIQGLSMRPPAGKAGRVVDVRGVLALDLYNFNGSNIPVSSLERPIKFLMPTKYFPGLVCGYWDEDQQEWSTRGVAVSGDNTVGSPISCETNHLSLFGALALGFVNAFVCSQFSLLSSEGIGALADASWLSTHGVAFLCFQLAVLGATAVAAVRQDWKRDGSLAWRDDFFLVPVGDSSTCPEISSASTASQVLEEVVDLDDWVEPEQEEEEHKSPKHRCCCARWLAICASSMHCLKETAFKDAVDEIMSEWFEQFGELRAFLEGIWDGMEVGAIGTRRLMEMSQSVMSKLIIRSSQYLVSASLGISGEVIDFVLQDPQLNQVLMNRLAKRRERQSFGVAEQIRASFWQAQEHTQAIRTSFAEDGVRVHEDRVRVSENAFADVQEATQSKAARDSRASAQSEQDWQQCTHREDAWAHLHDEISEHLHKSIREHRASRLPLMVWYIFATHNPFGMILSFDVFISSSLRAFLFVMENMGVLLVICLFFTASGMKGKNKGDSQGGCEGEELEEQVSYKIGRVLAIASGSILIAGIPVKFLRSMHKRKFRKLDYEGSPAWQRQLRAWRAKDRIILTLGSLYMVFALFFVLLFLANISDDDSEDWMFTGILSFVQDIMILPLAISILMPSLAGLLLIVNSRLSHVEHRALLGRVSTAMIDGTNVMLPITSV